MASRINIINKLAKNRDLTDEEFLRLIYPACSFVNRMPGEEGSLDIPGRIEPWTENEERHLYLKARETVEKVYGKAVYLRGLIEFTNYCKNGCRYCGINKGNIRAERYRLNIDEILSCCNKGYELGFRTFVLQGGEDPYYTDEMICGIISLIKSSHPDCAVTLSIGEKERESYQAYFDAGADRYLLREETSDLKHYHFLHPDTLSMEHRQNCLYTLKSIGYQVGAGFMVESPGQRPEHILKDLRFMQELGPHMIGVGPFIPHKDTCFAYEPQGSLKSTLHMLGIIRLMFPEVLLPATTALGTIDERGREKGLLAGANVIMPNLSPSDVRGKYLLYDGKLCTGDEAAEHREGLVRRVESVGCHVEQTRGDHISMA